MNASGEQAGASVTVGGNVAFSWSVERDATGRITSKQEVLDGVAKLYEYTYDDLGRLTGVTLDGAVVESYAYGENGARSLETNALRGVADKAYTYAEDHRLQSAGDTSYTYDADGFLQSKTTGADVTQYAYASTGELLSVHLPDGRLVEYENDALGRRVAKKIDSQITEKYLWLGRTRLLAVFNADGSLKYRFNYADGRMPVSMAADGQTYYLAYDQVGSLRAVTDANGLVVKLIEYDSFGNVLEDSNSALEVPFGFAGGLYDADTGLVRFGFRDYDAVVGRWTAKDPMGFKGGLSDLYGYCGEDGINYIDIRGFEIYQTESVGITASFPNMISLSLGTKKYKNLSGDIEKICITVSAGLGPGLGLGFFLAEGYTETEDFSWYQSGNVSASGFAAILVGNYFQVDENSSSIGLTVGLGLSATDDIENYQICFSPEPCPYQRSKGRKRKNK